MLAETAAGSEPELEEHPGWSLPVHSGPQKEA